MTPRRPAVPASSGRSAVAPRAAEQPGAPVVGAAAAEADHDPAGAGVERRQQQLADAVGARRSSGRSLLGQVQPAGLGALDVGRGRRRAAAWPAPGRRTVRAR